MFSYSVNDLLGRKAASIQSQCVFTFNKEIAQCRNMNQVQVVIESLSKPDEELKGSFKFFMIKVIPLINRLNRGGDREVMLQLIDITQKVLNDNLALERKYLSYLNSTISHEMRNPLNSISAQTQVIRS